MGTSDGHGGRLDYCFQGRSAGSEPDPVNIALALRASEMTPGRVLLAICLEESRV